MTYNLHFFRFNGSRAILSGPAGGVVGYALTTYKKESDLPVIGFDMGGRGPAYIVIWKFVKYIGHLLMYLKN